MDVGVRLQVFLGRENHAAVHNGAVLLVQSGGRRGIVPVIATSCKVR